MERRAAQTAIYEVLNRLVRMMAPILAFTAEDIWQAMPRSKKDGVVSSVHLTQWPAANQVFRQDSRQKSGQAVITDQIQPIIALIPAVTKALEEKRSSGLIGSSFDAKINILTKDQIRYTYLESLQADLVEILKVSQVAVLKTDTLDPHAATDVNFPDIAFQVQKADGTKCSRCWNFSVLVGKNPQHCELCDRCIAAIQGGK